MVNNSFFHIVRNPTLIYLSKLVKSECVSLKVLQVKDSIFTIANQRYDCKR